MDIARSYGGSHLTIMRLAASSPFEHGTTKARRRRRVMGSHLFFEPAHARIASERVTSLPAAHRSGALP
jgi:hypothetical protein